METLQLGSIRNGECPVHGQVKFFFAIVGTHPIYPGSWSADWLCSECHATHLDNPRNWDYERDADGCFDDEN